MAKLAKTTVTRHRSGFYGRIWQVVFWLFQIAMVLLVVANFNAVDQTGSDCVDAACPGGAVPGGGILAFDGWLVWVAGSVVLGILVFATRGKLVTYTVEK